MSGTKNVLSRTKYILSRTKTGEAIGAAAQGVLTEGLRVFRRCFESFEGPGGGAEEGDRQDGAHCGCGSTVDRDPEAKKS